MLSILIYPALGFFKDDHGIYRLIATGIYVTTQLTNNYLKAHVLFHSSLFTDIS